jgi:hypothetical protein
MKKSSISLEILILVLTANNIQKNGICQTRRRHLPLAFLIRRQARTQTMTSPLMGAKCAEPDGFLSAELCGSFHLPCQIGCQACNYRNKRFRKPIDLNPISLYD